MSLEAWLDALWLACQFESAAHLDVMLRGDALHDERVPYAQLCEHLAQMTLHTRSRV